jgi:gamma-glutamyltranspeptidase / glutathione hydrolase
MASTLSGLGGLHTAEDFAAASAEFVEPIHTSYRDLQVYQCPPNGQGVVTLLLLNLLEGFELSGMAPMSAERLHLIAEATKLAFRDRDAFLADPAFKDVPVARLLDKAYAKRLREEIDPDRVMAALPPPLLEAHPDTTYLSVVDGDLNAVSFINSLYDAFGSGIACETTGVLFHARGRAFKTDPAHPNCIAPGKRPMHTIIPGLAFRGGDLWLSYGVMGGNYQPVGHATLLSNLVDHGLGLQTAVDAPRIMAYPNDLETERGVPAAARAGLQIRGHAITEPVSPLGGGQAVMVDRRRGVLVGASDPRKDGIALGF